MKILYFFWILTSFITIHSLEKRNERITLNLDSKPNAGIVTVINKSIGNIDISTHDQNTVLIDVLKEATVKEHIQKLEVKADITGEKIIIEAVNNNKENETVLSWNWWVGKLFSFNNHSANNKSDKIDLTINIPKNCAIKIESHNGAIKLEGLNKPISVKSNLGSINIQKVTDAVYIASTNGKIALKNIKGSVRIEKKLGGIELEDIEGDLAVSLKNGSIFLRQSKVRENGKIDFNVNLGSIDLSFPSNQNALVKAEATLGPILLNSKKISSTSFGPGSIFNGTLINNQNSKLKVSLKSKNGSISIKHLP